MGPGCNASKCIGFLFLNASNTDWPYWCLVAGMTWFQSTWQETFNGPPIQTLDSISDCHPASNWSHQGPDFSLSATVLWVPLLFVSGTVYLRQWPLLKHSVAFFKKKHLKTHLFHCSILSMWHYLGLVSVIVSLQFLAYGTLNLSFLIIFTEGKNNNNNNNNIILIQHFNSVLIHFISLSAPMTKTWTSSHHICFQLLVFSPQDLYTWGHKKIKETRNVGQCPTWWPLCRI